MNVIQEAFTSSKKFRLKTPITDLSFSTLQHEVLGKTLNDFKV